jgi:hypothetical protein
MNKKKIILASSPQADKILYITPEVNENLKRMRAELYLHHLGTPGLDTIIKSLGLDIVFEPSGGIDDPIPNLNNPLAEYPAKIRRTLNNGAMCEFVIFPCPYSTRAVVATCLIPDEDLIAAHAMRKNILAIYTSNKFSSDHENLADSPHYLAKPIEGRTVCFEVITTLRYPSVIFDPNSIKIVWFESKKIPRRLQLQTG